MPTGAVALRLAAVAAAIDAKLNDRKRRISGQMPVARPVAFERQPHGARSAGSDVRLHDATRAERPLALRVRGRQRPSRSSARGGRASPCGTARSTGERVAVQVVPVPNGVLLSHAGAFADARVYTMREAELAAAHAGRRRAAAASSVLCPMPGLLREVLVAEGQAVKTGESLAVVEAMKMENVLKAERDGTVAKVHVAKPGDSLALRGRDPRIRVRTAA